MGEFSLRADDLPRIVRQREQILRRLKEGPATNQELSAIALRFGARLKELRDEGWPIATRYKRPGVYVYDLAAPE